MKTVNDLLKETLISVIKLPEHAPLVDGRKRSIAWAYRAAGRGFATPSGARVRLETVRVGATICTSIEALDRFLAAVNGSDDQATAAAPVGSSAQAAREQLAEVFAK